jgi:hypothetical protein
MISFIKDSKLDSAMLSKTKANTLSHAGRLTLIQLVFASISIYYMANILFSKKFLAKLTSVIRIFWWQGVQKEQQKKAHPLQIMGDNLQTKKSKTVWESGSWSY